MSPSELMNSLSFCIIDLETTGGNYKKDKIIEIGLVRVEKLKIVEEKSYLVNPEKDIPDFIQKLTKISQAKVKDKPVIEDIIDEVIDFIGDDILVAHNTSFDVPFLNGVISTLGKPELENKVICTNVMTKHLMPEILSSNLNYMCRLFNIEHSKAHRALDDALATAKLLILYCEIFIEKNISKVNQLYYPRNKFELDRVHFYKKDSTVKDVLNKVKGIEVSTLLTIKGERGLILATIPLSNPNEEIGFVEEILNELEWEIITIKLQVPLLEGMLQFNNHLLKYPEEQRKKLLAYLSSRYKNENAKKLQQLDFIIAPHIFEGQIFVFSFLNLNTNSKYLFKVPAQKKKLKQYLTSSIQRFERNQKGQKRHLLQPEVVPIIESFLGQADNLMSLGRKEFKLSPDNCIKEVEAFVQKSNYSIFPKNHL